MNFSYVIVFSSDTNLHPKIFNINYVVIEVDSNVVLRTKLYIS